MLGYIAGLVAGLVLLYPIITHLAKAQERDGWKYNYEDRDADFRLYATALEARVKRYREALEHITGNRGNLKECCRKAFQEDQLDNHDSEIANKALAEPKADSERA